MLKYTPEFPEPWRQSDEVLQDYVEGHHRDTLEAMALLRAVGSERTPDELNPFRWAKSEHLGATLDLGLVALLLDTSLEGVERAVRDGQVPFVFRKGQALVEVGMFNLLMSFDPLRALDELLMESGLAVRIHPTSGAVTIIGDWTTDHPGREPAEFDPQHYRLSLRELQDARNG